MSALPVGIAADIDDLGAVDGEDLVELLRRGGPGSFGTARHGEPKHEGVAVEVHALHGGHGAAGKQSAVPVEHLVSVGAQPGPLDLRVQERPEQIEVQVTVGGLKVPGDVGHDAGPDRAGHSVWSSACGSPGSSGVTP